MIRWARRSSDAETVAPGAAVSVIAAECRVLLFATQHRDANLSSNQGALVRVRPECGLHRMRMRARHRPRAATPGSQKCDRGHGSAARDVLADELRERTAFELLHDARFVRSEEHTSELQSHS